MFYMASCRWSGDVRLAVQASAFVDRVLAGYLQEGSLEQSEGFICLQAVPSLALQWDGVLWCSDECALSLHLPFPPKTSLF